MRKEIQEKIHNSQLNQIDLDGLHIEDHEIEEIALLIKRLRPQVQDIFLGNNKISDDGAIILGKEFASLKDLQFIDLQFNQIDKKGAKALLFLQSNHAKFNLALHGNKIKDQGEMQKIEDAVAKSIRES